jgi:hypothetical protein
MKRFTLLFALLFSMSALSACGPARVDVYVEVNPSETAFVIPLEGDTAAQGKFNSEKYLSNKKVAAKRIYLPMKEIDTGRFWWNYKWAPTVKVITVDRKPVVFEWEGKKGIDVESKDSIGFTVGINIAAHVEESDTAKFLYNYPTGNMNTVLGGVVKSKATEILSRAFANYDLEGEKVLNSKGIPKIDKKTGKAIVIPGARQQKGQIVDQAKKDLIAFFQKTGLTIDTFGLAGGLMYDDIEIQKAINENFRSELDIKNKANEKLAQKEINDKNVSEATADKLAALEFAKAAVARTKLVNLEVAKMNAEARVTWAKNWNGVLPTNMLPDNSNMLIQPSR